MLDQYNHWSWPKYYVFKENVMINDFVFYKMIDPKKNVSIVRNVKDGKNYVQKEYAIYNKSVFERLRSLNIPGIPKIYACEEVKDKLVIIEDYIKGKDLREKVEQDGSMDEEEVRNIALQLCDRLHALHSLTPPMIHRDIKPSNIIMTKDHKVVLIDFNISREFNEEFSQDTVLMGTRDFASPEQLTGYGASDATTDIFGLGATLNYLLTQMVIGEMIAPGRFEPIIKKCCEMDKKNRYQSVGELRQALIES